MNLRHLHSIGVATCSGAVVLLLAAPARPCSIRLPGLLDGVPVPFEDRLLPRNAELRVPLSAFGINAATLERPDGATSATGLESDALGLLFVPDTPLRAGAHALVLTGEGNGETTTRRIPFLVADREDLDAPEAPIATASSHTVGSPLSTCGPSWPTSQVEVTVETPTDGAVLIIDDVPQVSLDGSASATATMNQSPGGNRTLDVVVRDLAGNESAATRVEVWTGCQGGCASIVGTWPLAGVLAVLTWRRRLRAPRPHTPQAQAARRR